MPRAPLHPWRAALIISRYLLGQILRPLAAVFGVLVALFASYSVNGFLSDAVAGLLPAGAIAELTGLKVLIALEVLIPASLYVAVLVSFARLYADSEFTAMFALSVRPSAIMRTVLSLAACLALVVGGLSLFVRPWAYQRLHALSSRAGSLLDVDAMQAGSFYVDQNGARVIFLAHRDGSGTPARNVFVKLRHSDRTEIVSAKLAYAAPNPAANAGSEIYLRDAYLYEIDRANKQADEVLQAQGILVDPDSRDLQPPAYSAVAASSARIARSGATEDIAEFQWRLSTPLSTLLLGMLGVPLARTKPRENRYSRLAVATLTYFGYYLLFTSARTWVQHGAISKVPGIWWVPALLTLVLLTAIYLPTLDFALRRERA